jgi:hypothetical protein
MRIFLLVLLCLTSVYAQNPNRSQMKRTSCGCSPTPALFYRPVVHAMWEQDEGEHPHVVASGFIRIAIHPAWNAEFFVDVRLNREAPPTIVTYSLPKGTKTITSLIETELKENPCSDVGKLVATLPIKKRTFTANKQLEDLVAQFFTLRMEPRHIPDNLIRLDATEYDVEFVGDDTLVFVSDDYETPMVKWIESFVDVVNANSRR